MEVSRLILIRCSINLYHVYPNSAADIIRLADIPDLVLLLLIEVCNISSNKGQRLSSEMKV